MQGGTSPSIPSDSSARMETGEIMIAPQDAAWGTREWLMGHILGAAGLRLLHTARV